MTTTALDALLGPQRVLCGADCPAPMAALVTLARPVDFTAIDDNPVDVVFPLVVPDGATDEHLRLLARLAGLFSEAGLRARLRACRDDESLRATMPSAWSQGDAA